MQKELKLQLEDTLDSLLGEGKQDGMAQQK